MSVTSVISTVSTRTTVVGAAAVVAVLALTGCAGPGSGPVAAPRTTQSSSPAAAPTRSASADDAVAAMTDLSFEDGAAVPSTSLPAFALEVSGLPGWQQTGEDPSTGSREYTNTDGAVATLTQQRITDLDPSIGDRAATEQLFTASGLPADRLEEQLLPTAGGGTAQFLSIGGHDSDGSWSATVARAFAKPGAALVVKVRTSSQEALRADLHDVLVHAQVILT